MFGIFCTVYYENYKDGLIRGKMKQYKVCKKKHRTTTERRKKSHVLESAMQAEYCIIPTLLLMWRVKTLTSRGNSGVVLVVIQLKFCLI